LPDKPFSSETNKNNTPINPYETEDLNTYRGINDIVSKSSRKLYDNINEELFQKTGNN
jgi:hypothetical protein